MFTQEIIDLQIPPDEKPRLPLANPRNVCPEKCEVCGGVATGYHYEVPSCNGCKTFFRRTVLSKAKFVCKRSGKCSSDLSKKKQHWCRSCRFTKCVNAGMNPLAINSGDDHSENEVVQDIIRKRSGNHCSTSYELDLIPPSVSSVDDKYSRLIDGLLYVEVKKENFRRSRFNPNPLEISSLKELVAATNKLSLADVLGPMPNWPLKTLPPLTEKEREKWRREGLSFRPKEDNRKNWLYADLISTVEYIKTFPFFHSLDERDQMVLLKNVAFICFNLTQAYFSYENKSDRILYPDGTNMVNPSSSSTKYYTIVELKNKTMVPVLRNQLDRKEYVLLKALLLCNSGLSDLSNHARTVLENERQLVNKALFQLCCKQRGIDGPARFAANLSITHVMEHLTKQQRDVHLLLGITGNQQFLRGAVAELVIN